MLSPLLVLLLLVSTSTACSDSSWRGLLSNTFEFVPGYNQGVMDTSNPGEKELVTLTNDFGMFSNQFTISDQGYICGGNCIANDATPPVTPILAEMPYIAVIWIDYTVGYELSYEYKTLLRSSEFNDDGLAIGPNVCYFELVTKRLAPYAGIASVEELFIVTWKHQNDTTVILSQLVLAHTSDNRSFALMNFESTVPLNTLYPDAIIAYVHGNFPNVESAMFAKSCSDNLGMDLLTMSNANCGQPGQLIFDLDSMCTDTAICDNLVVDPAERDINCRDLVIPRDSCEVLGTCRRDTNDSFTFDFIFLKTLSKFGDFEVINSTNVLADPSCTLNATDEGSYYRINMTVNQTFIDVCGVYSLDDGKYVFTVLNFDRNSGILQQGTIVINITCNPDDLVSEVTAEITVGDINIAQTISSVLPFLNLVFLNKDNLDSEDVYMYQGGDSVDIGQPIYSMVLFVAIGGGDGGVPENVFPYGVYVDSCMIGNTADFSDQTVTVIQDRCPVMGLDAFTFSTGFKIIEPSRFHTIVAGPFRAAKWRSSDSIWMKCVIGLCITNDFADSYCRDSCNGTGVNRDEGARRRREISENSAVLTAHLRIIDKEKSEASEMSLSCVNETLAYATIIALVILLLLATAITALLFHKLKSRERKLA